MKRIHETEAEFLDYLNDLEQNGDVAERFYAKFNKGIAIPLRDLIEQFVQDNPDIEPFTFYAHAMEELCREQAGLIMEFGTDGKDARDRFLKLINDTVRWSLDQGEQRHQQTTRPQQTEER